jgi:hypothetical protein
MRLRFTKYSAINTLISFIPIFPTWTIFPGLILAYLLSELFRNCEIGLIIILISFPLLALYWIFNFFKYLPYKLENYSEKEIRNDFRFFCLKIYTSINTVLLIIIIGTEDACYSGDGQSILAVIFSAPIASVAILLLGVTVDLSLTEK